MPATLIPTLVYDDAHVGIEWLKTAFGFRPNLIVPGPDNTVVHSELSLGPDMVMVSSPRNNEFNVQSPRAVGGPTAGVYIVIDGDVDAHCARARLAGAKIIREPTDEDYGGRGYVCADPEGHLWSFGTYHPTA